MSDNWAIETVEQLRDVIGEPNPMTGAKVAGELDIVSKDFLNGSPLVLVATRDASGNLDVSPKGDAPGFCQIEDDQTLLLPERPGNKLAYGFLNILETGKIGLIFLLPGVRETLRINGRATLTRDPAILENLSADGRPALLATRIHIEECFMHCGKALIRSKLWQPEKWAEPPQISFGRQIKEKWAESSEVTKEIEDLADTIEEDIQKDYVEGLY